MSFLWECSLERVLQGPWSPHRVPLRGWGTRLDPCTCNSLQVCKASDSVALMWPRAPGSTEEHQLSLHDLWEFGLPTAA